MQKNIFFYLFFYLLALCQAQAHEEVKTSKTVCLNMIVKNETKVIQRCLETVKNHIDYWVIVDTGSSDGTQNLIKSFLKDIPGELHERPWVNFEHNRNEALSLAKGKADYLLFMDADEELLYDSAFAQFPLKEDYYFISVRTANENPISYDRFLLINNHLNWKWKDVLHEYLVIPTEAKSFGNLQNVICLSNPDGFRSEDPQKHYKDIAVLQKALDQDPLNSRYAFYLAQSYYNAKEYESALTMYEKRSQMTGGFQEEVFWSLYMVAYIQQILNKSPETFIHSYCTASLHNQNRLEPYFQMAQHFNKTGNHVLGYMLSKTALSLPPPQDQLYVQSWIYDYGILCTMADSALALNKKEEAKAFFQKALSKNNLPGETRKSIEQTLSTLHSVAR